MRAPTGDPMVGRTIAHYEVLTRIGGGGMGVVYRARDTRLGRTVALKFLPAEWSHDEDARQRFIREAQAASATNHQNICTIHDIETADDGQLFIVMAYYEGQTLKQRLAAGPLPVEEALDIATQIADGLAKAHAQSVVHRDVKPGNVMLTEDGVRILDFGLATFADALKLTVEHSTLGTAAYMSPEQVRGHSADARSDVWAAGVILYEMLAGHVPFQGSHAEAIAYAVRNETPAPIRQSRPEVAEEIEHLVFRAIHKEPAVRFKDGRELGRGLRQVRGQSLPLDLRTEYVPVPVATPLPPPRPRWKIPAAVATLVVALAGMATWLAWPVERTYIAVAPFGNQTGDPDLDQYRLALTQALTLSLRDARDLQVVPYNRVLEVLRRFIRDGTDISNRDAIQALGANTGVTLLAVPTLLREGGSWRARVELRDPLTANTTWVHETSGETSSLTRDVAYQLAGVLGGDIEAQLKSRRTSVIEALTGLIGGRADRPGRMRSLDAAKAFAEGIAWYDDLEYAKAIASFRAAFDLDPRNPVVLAWLSRAAQLARDEKEALDAGERAMSLLISQTPRVDALFVEAVSSEARRDVATAERAYGELKDERPDDPALVMELAGFLDRQTRNTEAVAAYHDVLKLDGRLLRPQLELCRLYSPSRLNEPANARTHGETAVSGYRALGASGGEGQSLLCLADVLAVGKDDERNQASAHARAAYKIFEDLRYDYSQVRAEYYLALVAGMQGRFAESVALGEQALSRARTAGNLAIQGTLMNNLGAAHVSLGNRAQGADYYQQAYKLFQSWRDEIRAARIQANRGALLIESGKQAEGLLDIKNALSVSERLGDRNFQTYCLRVMATYYRNQGRHADAIRELNKALAIARERNLGDNVTVMTTFVALSQFETGDYDAARRSLASALADGSGRQSVEARIRLARTLVRLGDLDAAETELQQAERDLQQSPNESLRSLQLLVRGEWALESQQAEISRISFERAAVTSDKALPEPTSIEARSDLGLLTARRGDIDGGRRLARAALAAAEELGHHGLVAKCRAQLVEIELLARRSGEAASLLNGIPPDDDAVTIAPELRAEVHHLRAELEDARGEKEAAGASREAARRIIQDLAQRVPAEYRESFAERPTLRQLR